MYYCNACESEIDDDDILYDKVDKCPLCQSTNVDYFPCSVSDGDKDNYKKRIKNEKY